MPWSRPQAVTGAFRDAPDASVIITFVDAIKVNDLVVIGVSSTPGGVDYVVTDDAPVGTFAWVSLATQVYGGGVSIGSILYAVATQPVPSVSVTVAPTPAGAASWVAIGGVYRHQGAPFVDQSTVGFGTGTALAGGLLTPASVHELAVAFGAYIPNLFYLNADAPLGTRLVIDLSVNMGMAMADALSVSTPFTPTMHLLTPGDWLVMGVTFGATVPPHTGQPGPFLGSGLEPFPMRRRAERGDYSSRTQIRRIQLLDLFKQEDEHG